MTAKRMTIMGTRHVVAAGHYLAAHAAFEILEAGGNAIDAGVAAGLTALGLTISVTGDDLHFVGGGRPAAGLTESLGDHRLAMTFAIAGLVSGAAVSVDDPAAAAVSYPTFYDDMARIGAAA